MCKGKQLDLLEHFRIGTKLWILDNLPGLSMRMLGALKAIQGKARSGPTATMTRKEIAVCCGASVPTVQRAINDLEQSGFLICRRVVVPGKGQQASEYQIVWSNLKAYADGEQADENHVQNYVDNSLPPVHPDPPPGSHCTTPRINMSQPPVHIDPPYYIHRKTVNNRNSMERKNELSKNGISKNGVLEKQDSGNEFSFGRKLTRDDFFKPERMQTLYERALIANLINGSEVDRQLFFGLLVYVRRQDKKKVKRKSGFLISLLRGTVKDRFGQGWRKRPTHEDTRAACKVIKRIDYGPSIDELLEKEAV